AGRWASRIAPAAFALALLASAAYAEDALSWLTRAASAARSINYVGTIVYQIGPRVESSRIAHFNDGGRQFEKLTNLDGPARELIRTRGEVRCYYPDAKLVRVEPRTFRNVFPALSGEQRHALSQYYDFRVVGDDRVSGRPAVIVAFQPRDGLRYGHRFWSDRATGLLLKARMVNEDGEGIEQFAFTDITLDVPVNRALVAPSWPVTPPDWQVIEGVAGDLAVENTGWVVTRLPAGFSKIMEGYRRLHDRHDPVAHLVYTDGLASVSVFIEAIGSARAPVGFVQQGGLNVDRVRRGDHLVTVMGETPRATVRQIANSVERR
ncbi:MAG: MucB/RseB C-terminal domain-containing protein, partial [Casimicrobiaceae bacterium]